MNMLVFCGLNDSKVKAKLLPIIRSSHIKNIFLIRDTKIDLPKVTCLSVPNFLFFSGFKFLYKFFLGLYFTITKKVDCILGIYLVPHGILSTVIGKILGVRIFISMIGTDVNEELPSSKILQILSKKNNIITVTGSKTKNFLTTQGFSETKIRIVPSYVEVDKFKPKKTSKKYDLIFIGSLNKNKQVDLIIDAFSKLSSNCKMIILGSGNLKETYISHANKIGVSDRVTFAGYQKDVQKYLHKSKVLVLASKSEGLPQCVMEAMSCGLPCVVPKINDITDLVIDKENSFFFNSTNTEDLSSTIKKLLLNESLYSEISNNARKSIVDKFSIEAGSKKWNEILHKYSL